MGNRRMGLGRMEKLLESVDRELNLVDSTLLNCTITTTAAVAFGGTTIFTRKAVTNLANDGSIPVDATCVNIDANGGARTGIRFGGTGTAGQMLVVQNTGGEKLTFNNTEGTALFKGISADHDVMPAGFVGLFFSDGALWNLIAGGVSSDPDVGLLAS